MGAKAGRGRPHDGNGGREDLIDDDATVYENVIGGGVDYQQTFDGTAVRFAGMAYNGNGVSGNHDLEAYYLAGQVGFANGIWASASWTHSRQHLPGRQGDRLDRRRPVLHHRPVAGLESATPIRRRRRTAA